MKTQQPAHTPAATEAFLSQMLSSKVKQTILCLISTLLTDTNQWLISEDLTEK